MRTRKASKKTMKEDSQEQSSPTPAEPKKSKQQIMREKNKKQGISQPSQQIGNKKVKGQGVQKRKSNSRNKKLQQEQASLSKDHSKSPKKAPNKMKSKEKREQQDQKQIESRLQVIQQKNRKTKKRSSKSMKESEKQQKKQEHKGQDNKLQQPSLKKQAQIIKSKGKVSRNKDKSGNKSENSDELLKLVYSKEMMDSYLQILGYDLKKMPVKNLSKDTIVDAYGILRSLEFQLKSKNDKTKIEELTRQFYEDIPHDFGFSTLEKNILDTSVLLNEKKLLLDSLLNYKTVASIVPQALETNPNIHQLQGKLRYKISIIPPDTQQYDKIKKYLHNNHSQIHKRYRIEPQGIYSVQSQQEDKQFDESLKKRKLLWFGTRLNNIPAILCEGFNLPQYDIPVASAPFGKGFYFTDCSSKAANNCYISKDEKTAVLIVCEVALGESVEMYYADPKADKLPPGKNSVKSVGKYSPSAGKAQQIGQMKIPMGPLEPVQKLGTSFLFNEYVVYRREQVRMKYLLRVRFEDAPE